MMTGFAFDAVDPFAPGDDVAQTTEHDSSVALADVDGTGLSVVARGVCP
jgi:hypothetical protein